MMKEESKRAAENFIRSAQNSCSAFLGQRSIQEYESTVKLILESQAHGGRLHITGIGKPGHVAQYAASLLSSTGTPCYFLDGTEAVHGSCGQLTTGDAVIAISNSGETQELKATVAAIIANGCKIIGISGNPESWLAKHSDAFLYAGVSEEGGPLDRAPRNSVLAEILTLQTLSVILQAECGLDATRYVRYHPGGMLGHLRENESGENCHVTSDR